MKISITTNQIQIPKKLFASTVDKELELDTSLPEYCADIARIVKVDCTPFAESCEAADGKATVKGKAVYDLLYETDYKNRLRCASFTQEFTVSATIPRNDATDISADCELTCTRIGCKLLSPRKLQIKTTLGASFDVEGEVSVSALAVNEDESTFFRKKTIGFDGRTKKQTDSFKFSDTIQLAQSEKSIGEIICGSLTLQPPQITLSPGRAEIRTTAIIRALYEEEDADGKYCTSQKSVPVSFEYLNDSIEDFKRISVKLFPFDVGISSELDQYGESRVLKAAFSVGMKLLINEPKAYTVADDVFEKGFDSSPVIGTASLPFRSGYSETAFSEEAKLAPTMPKIDAILDSYARDCGSSIEQGDGGVTVSGSFIVTLLVETADGVSSIDTLVPYSKFFVLDIDEGHSSLNASCDVAEAIPTLHSDGSISLKVIANARISAFSEKQESFVTGLTKRVTVSSESDEPCLVFCYAQQNESLWEVAKLYRASPESIKRANPQSFDEYGKLLDSGKPILIKL